MTPPQQQTKRFKTIAVTPEIYKELQSRGHTGQSFNDLLKQLLGVGSEQQ